MDAGLQRQGGMGVAQVVQANLRQLGPLAVGAEGAAQVVGMQRRAVLQGEHEPVSRPLARPLFAFRVLPLLPSRQRRTSRRARLARECLRWAASFAAGECARREH